MPANSVLWCPAIVKPYFTDMQKGCVPNRKTGAAQNSCMHLLPKREFCKTNSHNEMAVSLRFKLASPHFSQYGNNMYSHQKYCVYTQSTSPHLRGCHRTATIRCFPLVMCSSPQSSARCMTSAQLNLVRPGSKLTFLHQIPVYLLWCHPGSPGWPWRTIKFQAWFQGSKNHIN